MTPPSKLYWALIFTSAISLLGIPAEVYTYGVQYMYIIGGLILMGILTNKIYLPVLYNLKLTSSFEYLEKRFDKKVRLFASTFFPLHLIGWLPVAIYAPALAFNQVTGINIYYVTPVVCMICIFYTCIGGIKAVVWTDVVQTTLMYGSLLLIVFKGTADVGGISSIFAKNWNSGRIEAPVFSLNPLTRHTIWTLMIGGSVYWVQAGAIYQSMLQRYLALRNLKEAKKSAWMFVGGMSTMILICGYCGMMIYAKYSDCDPVTTKLVQRKDQLLPLFVSDVLRDIPGFPGMFVAGIFSAALSSLSTGLNSISAVVLEDYVKPCWPRPLSERACGLIMKTVVVLFGCLCAILVLVIEKLGAVLQLTMSLEGITHGPSLGLFTMGLLMPWVTANGALIGSLVSLVLMGWLSLNTQAAIASGSLFFPGKNVSTEHCSYHFTSQTVTEDLLNTTGSTGTSEVLFLYRLSYLWYTLMGIIITVVVGLVASFIFKPNNPHDIDPMLLSPLITKYIKPRQFPNDPSPDSTIKAYEEKNTDTSISLLNISQNAE